MELTLTKKQKQKIMKGIKYSKRYAIGKLYLSDVLNLYLFNEMDKKGYDLICVSFIEGIFRKRNNGLNCGFIIDYNNLFGKELK